MRSSQDEVDSSSVLPEGIIDKSIENRHASSSKHDLILNPDTFCSPQRDLLTTTMDMDSAPCSPVTRLRKESRPDTPAGQKHRTSTACTSCRIHKTKCDGAMPCSTCTARSYLCKYEKHQRQRHCSRLLQSPNYLELLEDQNQRLVRAVKALHKQLVDANAWDTSDGELPSVHHICEKLERRNSPPNSNRHSPASFPVPRLSHDSYMDSAEDLAIDTPTRTQPPPQNASEIISEYASFLQQSSLENLNKVYGNSLSSLTAEPQSLGDLFTRVNTSGHSLFDDLDASGMESLSTELMPPVAKRCPSHSDMPVPASHDDLDFGNSTHALGFRSSPTTMTDGLSKMWYHQAMAAYANQGIQRAGMTFAGHGRDTFFTS